MRNRCMSFVAVVFCAASVFAAADYSFEVIAAKWRARRLLRTGATVSQDTIGATDSTHSMKYEVGAGGFVGRARR